MAVILGLCAALSYGASDFLGGLVTRRTDVLGVVVWSQATGSSLLLLVVPFVESPAPTSDTFLWGVLAGACGAAGVTLFYRALALGKMSVIAPVTAVEAASVPVVFGLVTGERPPLIAGIGVVLALAAVGLVSAGPDEEGNGVRARRGLSESGLLHALGAGMGFGFFFIFLKEASGEAGLWPLVIARSSSLALAFALAMGVRRSTRPVPGTWPTIVAAGVLDVAANMFFLAASREGLLSIVAVLTSLYPASTIVLARTFLHERLARPQLAGLGLAVVGVVFIAFA
jgi:drug/metabolite transporter (DMT)-like permease